MRELTKNEIQCIAGGYFDLHKANFPKPSVGMKVADGAVRAIPAVRWGTVAFEVGYETGKLINKHTPIQDWIGKGLDKLTGLNKG